MRTESPSTTDRNLKSRYLDHDRQKQQLSHDMGSKKVMLTDLCPQEKIKIGQLIEALE